jgi:hypothetical protein
LLSRRPLPSPRTPRERARSKQLKQHQRDAKEGCEQQQQLQQLAARVAELGQAMDKAEEGRLAAEAAAEAVRQQLASRLAFLEAKAAKPEKRRKAAKAAVRAPLSRPGLVWLFSLLFTESTLPLEALKRTGVVDCLVGLCRTTGLQAYRDSYGWAVVTLLAGWCVPHAPRHALRPLQTVKLVMHQAAKRPAKAATVLASGAGQGPASSAGPAPWKLLLAAAAAATAAAVQSGASTPLRSQRLRQQWCWFGHADEQQQEGCEAGCDDDVQQQEQEAVLGCWLGDSIQQFMKMTTSISSGES